MHENILDHNHSKITKSFNIFSYYAFLCFIFLTLSIGRPFSLIHLGYLFITEIVLFLCFIFVLFNAKSIPGIPVNFSVPLLGYFTLGLMHLLANLLQYDLYALRGIVFFGYTVFLPTTFIIFSDKNQLKKLIFIIILSNIIGLTLVRLCIYRQYPLIQSLIYWWGQIKAINFVLYFGLTLSFLLPLSNLIKNNILKFSILLLCSINCYMLIIWGVRTSWVALIVLILFLTFLLKKNFFKTLTYFLVILLLVSTILGLTIDRDVFKEDTFLPKLTSLVSFIKKKALKPSLPETTKALESPKPQSLLKPPKPTIVADAKKTSEKSEASKIESDNNTPVNYMDTIKQIRALDYVNYFSNIEWRLIIWKQALRGAFELPIFGKGFEIAINPLYFNENHENIIGPDLAVTPLHNHIVSIFYKLGIAGLGLFIFFNLYCFLYGWIYLKYCKSEFIKHVLVGALGSFVYWHIIAFFYDVMDSPPTSIFLWVIMGLIFACVAADKNSPNVIENEKV